MFFRHHLKVTYRNLWKHKATTSINIIGLAIGIGAFIAIMNIVAYERSFNHHVPGGDRIYRIYTGFTGSFTSKNRGTTAALVPYLRTNESGLESITSFYNWRFESVPEAGEDGKTEEFRRVKAVFADSSFFDVFQQYKWLAGQVDHALSSPFQVVLTADQGTKYFGNMAFHDMLGKQVTYQDSLTVEIVGIVEQTGGNSDFVFTDFISQLTIESSWLKGSYGMNWEGTSSGCQAWVKLINAVDVDNNVFLKGVNQHVAEIDKEESYVRRYHLQSLGDLHFNVDLGIFDSRSRAPANEQTLLILSLVSFAVLLIAIFNFVNLESAQVSTKSKESGIRKVIGGNTFLLIYRFLTESMVVTFLAVLLAIPLAHFGLIYFESFLPNPIPLNWESSTFWVFIVGIFLIVGLTSGLYPALLLSSVKTANALKASAYNVQGKRGFPFFRRVFISFQFAFSQLLLICTIAAALQLSFMLDKDMGFTAKNILVFYTPWGSPESKEQVLINKLEGESLIDQVLVQDNPPAAGYGYSTDVLTYVTDEEALEIEVERKRASKEYLEFYDIPLLAGGLWQSEDREDQLVVNESFVKRMGLKDPTKAIGLVLDGWEDEKHTIVGVMKDFHSRSLRTEIMPLMFRPPNGNEDCLAVKVNSSDVKAVIEVISKHWSEIYPDDPAEILFLDDEIRKYYESEQQTSKLSGFTTIIVILISALGLFGLVSLTIVHRTKEVGIRKVLGASFVQIGILITSEFVVMTLIAFCLAVPFAYFAIDYWMESFAYRTDISWWVYVIGGLASIIIALTAIGSKVYRSAQTNPVEALRYE